MVFAGYASAESGQLARRVEQVFREASGFFAEHTHGRYAIGLGSQWYLLERTGAGFRWTRHDTRQELLDTLAQPRDGYSPPGCEPGTLAGTALPAVFQACRPGELQLFYHCEGGRIDLYTLDENGSLLVQSARDSDPSRLLAHQIRFLECLSRMHLPAALGAAAPASLARPSLYRLEPGADSSWRAARVSSPVADAFDDRLEVRLTAENAATGVRTLSVICGGRELNALTLGDRIYRAAAEEVLRHRDGGSYPIYLTQVELVADRYGVAPSGVAMLTLKQQVERRLNLELAALTGGGGR
jgi:hypothetical protein